MLHADILSSLENILTKARIAGTGHKTHLNLILGNTACLSFSNFLTSITQVLHRPTHTHMHEHSHTHMDMTLNTHTYVNRVRQSAGAREHCSKAASHFVGRRERQKEGERGRRKKKILQKKQKRKEKVSKRGIKLKQF